jgi:hypothetical protein
VSAIFNYRCPPCYKARNRNREAFKRRMAAAHNGPWTTDYKPPQERCRCGSSAGRRGFCRECWTRLPEEHRQAVINPGGTDDAIEAYAIAEQWLRMNPR